MAEGRGMTAILQSEKQVFSVCASYLFVGDGVGELHACLGVDVQAARSAPIGKRFGIDDGAYRNMAVESKLLLDLFGFRFPYREGAGQYVAIGHDPQDGAVILGAIPGDAEGANGNSHGGVLL